MLEVDRKGIAKVVAVMMTTLVVSVAAASMALASLVMPDLATGSDVVAEVVPGDKPSGNAAKISSELRRMVAELGSTGRRGAASSSVVWQGPRLREDGRLEVYLRARPFSAASRVARRVRENGDHVDRVSLRFGLVQAWVKPRSLAAFAELDDVAWISTPGYALPQAGSTSSEGDAESAADVARTLLKADGSGVVVGVLAVGVDSIEESAATGDLPAVSEIDVRRGGSGDEGTAMLEIIHDLAPGAGLAFYQPRTSLDMIAGIRSLVDDAGANVVVDDLTFLDEPVFEDGMIAQVVADVVSEGISYHTSAGNQGVGHYQGDFDGENIQLPGGDNAEVHEFGNDDPNLDISVAPMGTAFVVLQWDDPFGGSSDDYDLLVYDDAFSRLHAAGSDVQNGSQDPLERVTLTNPTQEPLLLKAVVRKFSGEDRRVDIHVFSDGRILDHNVPHGAVFGHAAVPGALAVGAVNAGAIDGSLAPYSSQGPSRITRPQIEIRDKPDIVASDGVSVSGAGGFPSTFFGTSASVAHSSAVASLLLSAGAKGGAAVFDCITWGAEDRGAPGFDDAYGWGFLDAESAAEHCFPGLVCGDANRDGKRTASDALVALKTGVGAAACVSCSCDVNDDGGVSATDGLLLLQFGVGQDVPISCPACF